MPGRQDCVRKACSAAAVVAAAVASAVLAAGAAAAAALWQCMQLISYKVSYVRRVLFLGLLSDCVSCCQHREKLSHSLWWGVWGHSTVERMWRQLTSVSLSSASLVVLVFACLVLHALHSLLQWCEACCNCSSCVLCVASVLIDVGAVTVVKTAESCTVLF